MPDSLTIFIAAIWILFAVAIAVFIMTALDIPFNTILTVLLVIITLIEILL